MKTSAFSLLIAGAALLAACNNGGDSKALKQAAMSTQPAAPTAPLLHSVSDYRTLVQQLYVAYFGRPADAAGLTYQETSFAKSQVPTTLADIVAQINGNPSIAPLLEHFAGSDEAAALYKGDDTAFLRAVYKNLFNRAADDAGLAYWTKQIGNGAVTRANAAISIMASATRDDLTVMQNKVAVAGNFTDALNTSAKAAAYSGDKANAAARALLAKVGATTSPASVQADVDATVLSLADGKPATAKQ